MPPFHLNALEAIQLHRLAQQITQVALPASTTGIAGKLPKGGLIKAGNHLELLACCQIIQAYIHSITRVMGTALRLRVLQHILTLSWQSQISQLAHTPRPIGIPQH